MESRSIRRWRPLVAALVIVLLVTACGGAAAPSAAPTAVVTPAPTADPGSAATVTALRAEPYGTANTKALIEAVGRSGIAVVADVTKPDPVSPIQGKPAALRFTDWQAQAMGLEAATGGGITGRELDTLIPVPKGMPRTSRIVAGYLAKIDSNGARLGRALLGNRDWTQPDDIVFPTVVLATLSAEVASQATAGATPSTLEPRGLIGARLAAFRAPLPGGNLAPAAGVCADVAGFIEDTISAVFDSIKVQSDGSTAGDIAAGIWNFLVEIGEVIVKSVLEVITAPVLAVIRAIAGGVAVVAMVVSVIQPWGLRVTADPATTRLAVGNEPGLPGEFRAVVDVGGIDDWPDEVAGCAATAGVPLPPLGADGAPLTWKPFVQGPSGLLISGEEDVKMPDDGPAKIAWVTGSEDPETAKGEARVGEAKSQVEIKRPGLKELQGALQSLLFAQLPEIIAAALAPILGPIIAEVTDRIFDLQDVRGSTTASVTYHIKPEETPKPQQPDKPASVGHPCDYVSTGDLNAIAQGNWSASRKENGAFKTCQFDDPGAKLIPPSFAVVSITTSYPDWDKIAKGADAEAVGGLGDEAYFTGSGQVLFVKKGSVVISTSIADMIVEDEGKGDFTVDPDADHDKAVALARLVLGKLP